MKTLTLLLGLLLAARAHASDLEARYFARLRHAHSAREIDSLRHNYDELRLDHLACRIQLRERQVPLACYESLRLEMRLGLTEHPQTLRAELDRRCRDATARLAVPQAAPPSGVSAACLGWIRDARRINAYRSQGDSS